MPLACTVIANPINLAAFSNLTHLTDRGVAVETAGVKRDSIRQTNMARQCLFCTNQKLTKEHIWPSWLVELFKSKVAPRKGLYKGTHTVQQQITKQFKQETITERRSLVCAVCNNGWMSGIEDFAKIPLRSLIEVGGERGAILSVEVQCAISIWIQLRSFIFDALYQPPAEPHYTFADRVAFATDPDCFSPLPNTYIWLAAFNGKGWSTNRRVLNGTPKKIGVDARVHVVTGVANRLAFQLFRGAGENKPRPTLDVIKAQGWDTATCQIWPCTGDTQWPPPFYLDDESLDPFQTRFSSGPDGVPLR